MRRLYADGHRVVVSFSGGKDSTCALEVCVLAAQAEGRLPVEVILRDEEIMFPGTFEFCERTAAREDLSFNWIYACQPVINVFNRAEPYFWVFDPLLKPEEWVRQPPVIARRIPDMNIERMTIPQRFPPHEGKNLYAVIGLRVQESRGRLYAIFSSRGYVTKANKCGTFNCRPIYDWYDGDVWKAIHDNHWDYNEAYDVMARLGIKRTELRIAPPTMNIAGVKSLMLSRKAWPKWFELVAARLPGVRAVAEYGVRTVKPMRRLNETWEQCFHRVCINEAPAWIRERAERVEQIYLSKHANHASPPFPDLVPCYICSKNVGCWKALTIYLYGGDPFSQKFGSLAYVEPEFFRPGWGKWDGVPHW
jgi:predicted phosphoadenosine phosphosulfate sulfurtransferase